MIYIFIISGGFEMIGIIVCNEHIKGLDALSKDRPAPLLRLCARTLLYRTLDKLIAVGIDKAYVVSGNNAGIARAVNSYDNKDKIAVSGIDDLNKASVSITDDLIVCDAVACADLDISNIIGNSGEGKCYRDRYGNFILAKLDKSDIRQDDFTGDYSVFTLVKAALSDEGSKITDADIICDLTSFLRHQALMLDKSKNGIVNNSDSNFSGVTIIPPVYIGKNVTIKAGSIIGQGSVIDNNARIEANSSVMGSYVGVNAVVGKNCMVSGSYIGDDCVLMNRIKMSENSAICGNLCIKANSVISKSEICDSENGYFCNLVFKRGCKPLEFDDDGICSLFDGTSDVSGYVKLGKAIASVFALGSNVVVGHSDDEKMDLLTDALCCGICSGGVNVLEVGSCTVPILGSAVTRNNAELGVFVGVDANGDIRLVQQSGLPLTTKLEQSIVDSFNNNSFRITGISDCGERISAENEKTAYASFLSDILPKKLKGLRISVNTSSIKAQNMYDKLLRRANDINGKRIVFQLSSDLTTLNAYSEETGNVRWEQLCLLGCLIMFEENRAVSLPYSLPSSAESLSERTQATVYRYCTVCVDESDAKAREEASKPKSAFVRDALLLCSMICRYLNDKRISFKEALDSLEQICCTQRYINGCCDRIFSIENSVMVKNEGVRVSDEHSKAFVRPSKDKRSLMIFAESVNSEFASSFCDKLSEKLRKHAVFGDDPKERMSDNK